MNSSMPFPLDIEYQILLELSELHIDHPSLRHLSHRQRKYRPILLILVARAGHSAWACNARGP